MTRAGAVEVGRRVFLHAAFPPQRSEPNIQPSHRASVRLVRRCGFRRERFSPRYLKVSGRWRDHERSAITAEDLRE